MSQNAICCIENIPHELKELAQWVVWQYEPSKTGNPRKVPYQAKAPRYRASTTNPRHWSSFAQATAALNGMGFSGIGFVFSEHDPFVGVDFDHCVEGESINAYASGWLESLDTYSEYSPSGTGVHAIVRAQLPRGYKTRLVELYDRGRFFTFTGNRVIGTPKAPRIAQDCVNALLATIAQDEPETTATTTESSPHKPISIDDEKLLEKMFASKGGSTLRALWSGDCGALGQSEADMKMAGALAYWTGRDHARIERMMQSSGLARDKWESKRGEITWLQYLINQAVSKQKKVYIPTHTDSTSAAIRAFRTIVEGYRWKGRNADNLQRCALAIVGMVERAHSVEIHISTRNLADLSGVSRKTAERALLGTMPRLTEAERATIAEGGKVARKPRNHDGLIHLLPLRLVKQGNRLDSAVFSVGGTTAENDPHNYSMYTGGGCIHKYLCGSFSAVVRDGMTDDSFSRGATKKRQKSPEIVAANGLSRLDALRELFGREVVENKAAKSFSTVGLRIIAALVDCPAGLNISQLSALLDKHEETIGVAVKRMTTGIALYNCEPIVIVTETITSEGKSKVITLPEDWRERVNAARPYLATNGINESRKRHHALERIQRIAIIRQKTSNPATLEHLDKIERGARAMLAALNCDFAALDELLNRADYIPDEASPADTPRKPPATAPEPPSWLRAAWDDEYSEDYTGEVATVERLYLGHISEETFGQRTEVRS